MCIIFLLCHFEIRHLYPEANFEFLRGHLCESVITYNLCKSSTISVAHLIICFSIHLKMCAVKHYIFVKADLFLSLWQSRRPINLSRTTRHRDKHYPEAITLMEFMCSLLIVLKTHTCKFHHGIGLQYNCKCFTKHS